MQLNGAQKRRWLEMLEPIIEVGVIDVTAERNKKSISKEEVDDWPTVADFLSEEELEDQLKEQLESIGFTEGAQEKATALFFQAVESRLHEDPFRKALQELLESLGPSPFISDEELNAAEILALRIQDLEADLQDINNENRQLAREIIAATPHPTTKEERSPKRSTIEQYLNEADENNADNLYNQEESPGNKRMHA